MPRLQIFERGRATAFFEAGVPVKEVARRLGVSPNARRKLRAKFQGPGEVKDRPRSGRPRVTSVRQDMSIVSEAETRRKLTGT